MARRIKNAAQPQEQPTAANAVAVVNAVPAQTEPTRSNAPEQPIRLKVVATKVGFYGSGAQAQRYYPAGHDHPMAGSPFWIGADALPKNKDGEPLRDKYGELVLPKWMRLATEETMTRTVAAPQRTNRTEQPAI